MENHTMYSHSHTHTHLHNTHSHTCSRLSASGSAVMLEFHIGIPESTPPSSRHKGEIHLPAAHPDLFIPGVGTPTSVPRSSFMRSREKHHRHYRIFSNRHGRISPCLQAGFEPSPCQRRETSPILQPPDNRSGTIPSNVLSKQTQEL